MMARDIETALDTCPLVFLLREGMPEGSAATLGKVGYHILHEITKLANAQITACAK